MQAGAVNQANSTATALAILFLYSVAMFSLPFAAYFGMYHILSVYYPVSQFARTAWSVFAAVVMVNIIIAAYAYRAYHEKEYDDEGKEIDQHSYPPPGAKDKNALNSKED